MGKRFLFRELKGDSAARAQMHLVCRENVHAFRMQTGENWTLGGGARGGRAGAFFGGQATLCFLPYFCRLSAGFLHATEASLRPRELIMRKIMEKKGAQREQKMISKALGCL